MLRSLPILATLFGACILFLSTGCEAKKEVAQPSPTELPSIAEPGENAEGENGAVAKAAPANVAAEDEVEAFAKLWAQAVNNGDTKELQRLVDWQKITERAIDNFDLEKNQRSVMLAQSSDMARSINTTMKTLIDKGGAYKLVRIAKRDDYYHAIFRLLTAESALNYHDLRVVKSNDGVIADQFFVAATGEEMSDTLRGVLTPLITSNKTVLSRLSGKQKQAVEDLKQLQKMSQLMRLGQHQQVVDLYDGLSVEGKKIKTAMLVKLMSSSNLAEDTYLKSIDDYARAFPNDPSLALLTMDSAIMKKDLKRLEKSRQELNAWTGGDAYIDLAVGAVMADAGSVDEAVELTKDIDPAELDLLMGYDFKLSIALPAKDYDTVLKNLLVLKNKFGLQLDISSSPDFADFVASPQGKKFLGE